MTGVLCVGMAAADFTFAMPKLPQTAQKYVAHAADIVGGGMAANAAVAVARLGGAAVLGAQLGDDAIGNMIVADLRAEGVDTSQITRTQGARSSYSSVYIDAQGERQIVNFRGQGLRFDTSWFADLAGIGAVLVDTRQVPAALDALAFAKKRGLPGIVDGEAPIDTALLAEASHIALSMQGLASLCPDQPPDVALARLAADYGVWACVTDGENGAWYHSAQGAGHQPAFAVRAVDTLGAGDVWHGAFALALAEGQTELQAMRFAAAAAALKCMAPGGRAGAPTRARVEEFLNEKSA